ncbi:MAG: hypothetical protein VE98_C0001G0135 [candidate division Kazan bacterium GW2011_GWA1_50_15]|uniref:Uncharacterized protein n=2 Tax=Bacteria division Kazan-3B-28 TaxID=1798534 RepID=A0A0G2A3V5_UNCK3|nr:MAG: hypothetical protein VE98_C0001G0135 [candidate division Kazan bacterium GW2011_GWA1_50_15]KKW25589.1 MAG: hypothetical protein VE99_C0001G0226 [candidate division Kazan bacterium GW2011_GWC1_52_13]KKW26894.1 MAG: hypothetical protein VF00_C0002G0219 [candidate division Kazan bacterium GW2011_GWB1_52_7]HAV66114.1 hypothetical protein [Patescibacteria group bacterium]HCR42702.1 hypothetical protein [Patescibacteria group bacterium]
MFDRAWAAWAGMWLAGLVLFVFASILPIVERSRSTQWLTQGDALQMYVDREPVKTVTLFATCELEAAVEKANRKERFKPIWEWCQSGQGETGILRRAAGSTAIHFALPMENKRDLWNMGGQSWPDLEVYELDEQLSQVGGERVEVGERRRVGDMFVIGYVLHLSAGRYAIPNVFRTG